MPLIANCILLFFMLYLSMACNDTFVPKSTAYFRIDLPLKAYRSFDLNNYPYTFEYPQYAVCEKDDLQPLSKEPENNYWLNIQFPSLNGTIYLTYKSIVKHQLDILLHESFQLTNKQMYKATSILDSAHITPNGYQAILFNVTGDAATSHQFLITDKKKHFLRGSLYFKALPNEDSLKLLNDFIYKDIIHFIQTLKFK